MEDRTTVETVKENLLEKIFSGEYQNVSTLPGERALAEELNTNRTVLRQILYELQSDGLLEIQQGKSTKIHDIWDSGNLKLLDAILKYPNQLPPSFMIYALYTRTVLAPQYTRLALLLNRQIVINVFDTFSSTSDTPIALVERDWEIHAELAKLSNNPIFLLFLNSFKSIPKLISYKYFENPQFRQGTLYLYKKLAELAQKDIDETIDFLEYGLARGVLNWHHFFNQIPYEQAKKEITSLIPTLKPILDRNYY